jgi:hypothetical protein
MNNGAMRFESHRERRVQDELSSFLSAVRMLSAQAVRKDEQIQPGGAVQSYCLMQQS